MATFRSLGSFAQHGTLLAIIGVLSACQSGGLTPPQRSVFQASGATPVNSAQRSQHKTTGYSVSPLATLGGSFGTADGINNKSWITGQSGLASGETHAALWSKGSSKGRKPEDLGTLGGPNSFVQFPIKSNSGDIAGNSDTTTTDPYDEDFCGDGVPETCLPFDWRGRMHALPTLGGNNGQADGNNSAGDIVGFTETKQDPSCVAPQVFDFGATLWRRGQVVDLGYPSGDIVAAAIAINNRGDAVGISGPNCGSPSFQLAAHPVLWGHGGATILKTLGGTYNNAGLAINDRGDIVGVSDLPGDGAYHAVMWKRGSLQLKDLGTLPGDVSSEANGVNAKGQIVGVSIDGSGNSRAVLWENSSTPPIDLNTLIPPSSYLYLFYGADINDAGVIVGDALDTTSGNMPAFVAKPNHGEKITPTPRQKVTLPKRALERLMRGSFGHFPFGLIHR